MITKNRLDLLHSLFYYFSSKPIGCCGSCFCSDISAVAIAITVSVAVVTVVEVAELLLVVVVVL